MSSPFNADALDALRRLNASRRGLVKIELTEPSLLTLHYATNECWTPDGQFWQTGATIDAIRESIGYLAPGVTPVDASVRLAKRMDASQTGGTLHDLLSDYLWQNAFVTIYLWAEESAEAPEQVFSGRVSRPVKVDPEGMTLHLLQDMSWNRIVPTTVVDKVSYPDSPDVSQGLPIPIVYGDHIAEAMRSPWATPYGSKQYQEDSGAGAGVVPGVLVDAGVGGADVKVVYAGHLVGDLLNRANGYSQFIVGNQTLAPMSSAPTESLGASESFITIADENAIAKVAVIPIDVRAGGVNTALNPRRAMDPFDETTYATLNQNTSNGLLQLILPNEGSLGRIESVQVYVAWSGNAGNTHNLRANVATPGVGVGGSPVTWAATSTSLAVQQSTWPTTYWNQEWAFGTESSTSFVFDLRIDFAGGTVNQARIYWVALVVTYRPQRSLVTPGRIFYKDPNVINTPGMGDPQYIWDTYPEWRRNIINIPHTYSMDGQFYANIKGYLDNGGGTYTGSASAIIQRPPDIARHFLETYGGVALADIEDGTDTTGSFVDARSTLRNAQPNDMELACWVGERSSVQHVLQKIAVQGAMCIYLDRFTDIWLCFVWKRGANMDYDRELSWLHGDLASFECEETSVVDVRHSIRVKYGFDHFKNKTLHEAYLTPETSGQGTNLPTIRDQRLVITDGSNDDVDFMVGGSTYAAVLDPGTYEPMDLAVEAREEMRTASGGNTLDCGYGFHVRTGFNDLLDFLAGANVHQATLAEGDYTPEALADEVARAMNAEAVPGHTYRCVYSHATNKFTISAGDSVTVPGACNNTVGNTAITRVSGSFVDDGVKEGMHTTHPSFLASDYVVSVTPSTVTMSGNSSAGFVNATVTWLPMVDVDATPGAAGYATSAVHLLGQTLPTAAAASLTMEVERYGDRFWFLCGNSATTINLLWATGASAVTNAAFVFGNDRGANSGNTRNHPCRFARGDRERIADGYQDLYGPRPEEQITADWIREETTAVELRNRLFDLSAQPRVIVRFASFRTPDLRRMQVISFASDLDSVVAYPKYGSDGSWSGKRFRVLEVEQNMGPQFHTEILAVEAD